MSKNDSFALGCIVGMIVLTVALTIVDITDPTPKAIDVYQGKTMLQITYQDGLPIDSIVVFKNN